MQLNPNMLEATFCFTYETPVNSKYSLNQVLVLCSGKTSYVLMFCRIGFCNLLIFLSKSVLLNPANKAWPFFEQKYTFTYSLTLF